MKGRSIQSDRRRRDGDDFEATRNAGKPLEAQPPTDRDHIGVDGLVRVPGLGADPAPTFKAKGEQDLYIGNDGDGEVGRTARDQAVGDMLDSGHGFLTRKIPEPKTTGLTACEICGGPLPTPGEDPDWLCQYYDQTRPASMGCNCPWCLKYQDYMAGFYKPQGGRPRQRCGSKACDRKADAQRKAQKRLDERRKKLLAEANEHMAWFDSLPDPDPETPAATLDDVPAEIREQVRAKLNARLELEPPVWNRKRRRNEPDWHLSFQRKRGSGSPVRKTP